MKNLVSRFMKDESGATAIEYGLRSTLGRKLTSTFTAGSNQLK